jgi:two-component system OmpR family response regulator
VTRRVLVVDDDPDVVESLAMALEGYCEVLTAPNGKEALGVILREPIDAIILDLMMPIMSGEELIAELGKRAIKIPVIVASASRDVESRCEALGVEHCLQKPYRLSKLIERLDAVSSVKS